MFMFCQIRKRRSARNRPQARKQFIRTNDNIKRIPTCNPNHKLCIVRTIFAQNEQLKYFVFSLNYLLLHAVLCSPGTELVEMRIKRANYL